MDSIKKKQFHITQTTDACSNMIVEISHLRLSILDLFTTLADGGPEHDDLIQYVSHTISNITSYIRGLDQAFAIIYQNQSLINPGESMHLGLDSSADKHNLYIDLCKSYKTFSKLQDYSAHCHALLLQQSLKRVHKRFDTTSGALTGSAAAPGAAGAGAGAGGPTNPYLRIYPPRSSVQTMLETYLKVCEYMDGTYIQPFGSSTGVLQITVNRVLKAILVMRGIVINAVIVKAHHESFAARKSSSSTHSGAALPTSCFDMTVGGVGGGKIFLDADDDIDLWSESKYNVFRRLTHHANAAVLHFQYPAYPEIAVRSFLSWFNSYADLFSATCSRCNSRLRKFMPPICRDFSSGFHPHHDSCK